MLVGDAVLVGHVLVGRAVPVGFDVRVGWCMLVGATALVDACVRVGVVELGGVWWLVGVTSLGGPGKLVGVVMLVGCAGLVGEWMLVGDGGLVARVVLVGASRCTALRDDLCRECAPITDAPRFFGSTHVPHSPGGGGRSACGARRPASFCMSYTAVCKT